VRSTAADACTTFDENVKGVTSHAVEEKVGVLLFNLGGPETLNDVQPFLFNLFADPVSDRAACSLF
jgi:ferrochelatase